MNKKILSALILILFVLSGSAQELRLSKSVIITNSVKVKRNIYHLAASGDLDQPVVLIKGNNIVVDFNNAILIGSNSADTPDTYKGVAVIIKDAQHVTVKNLTVKGYKIALLAEDVSNLTLENCDFSYNYRKNLESIEPKEIKLHHNEAPKSLTEYLHKHGAAISLQRCNNAIVRNCRVTNGQNALVLSESNNGLFYNNDFSFNSGVGVEMKQSSNNKLLYNKVRFNISFNSLDPIKGMLSGAGFVLHENSNGNLFFKNAAMHNGNGLSIGSIGAGCHNNIVFGNDFSFSRQDGIILGFNSNQFINNRIFECNRGIVGSYSYQTRISENQFRNNKVAIAITNGRQNIINHNIFVNDEEAIRLSLQKDSTAGTIAIAHSEKEVNRGYILISNSFNKNAIVYNLSNLDSIAVFGNYYSRDEAFEFNSNVTGIDDEYNDSLLVALSEDIHIDTPAINNPINPFKGGGKLAGTKNIKMTKWGPYDFTYPIILRSQSSDSLAKNEFLVLGPRGKWHIIETKGGSGVSKKRGNSGERFLLLSDDSAINELQITAAFKGDSYVDAFGKFKPAKKKHRFHFTMAK